MNKNTIILITVAVVLTGLYAIYFSDWFGGATIHIIAQIRPGAGRNAKGADPVSFMLDRKYQLKRVTVTTLDSGAPPLAVWSMVSESNSPPLKAITFGGAIPGLHPVIAGQAPTPLEPNKSYRLEIEARGIKGEVTFKAQGKPVVTQTNAPAAPLPPPK